MKFLLPRALVLALIGLPLGFILTALVFAVTQTPIAASTIFPWALAVAFVTGCAGGIKRV